MNEDAKILVTGGAGFIGSAVIRLILSRTQWSVLNLDKLAYAATPDALASVEKDARYRFEKVDICDAPSVAACFDSFSPDAVLHLAAESHVDRSIDEPAAFVTTNVLGTCRMLEAATDYWQRLSEEKREKFRFVHVSTDEVFGSLQPGEWFGTKSPYKPNSPYSASKAGADHLVRAWHRTYGLPAVSSNSSNNYGPFQFPEKLIPLTIVKALSGEPIPIYGAGENERDWLFVDDHASALIRILEAGVPGETYLVGGEAPSRNIDIVRNVCRVLDHMCPGEKSYEGLIQFVADRPGHDLRYATDSSSTHALSWKPEVGIVEGLERTVHWYLENRDWWQRILAERYDGSRLGDRRI
jgi:dTDP-glucose 4,6-dehydratase